MCNYSAGYGDFAVTDASAKGFDQALYGVLTDVNLFFHRLNQEEKSCIVQHHVWLWKHCYEKMEPLKLRNLLRYDYTYHDVDMRLFLPYRVRARAVGTVCTSCIYYYRGYYRIFIRFQASAACYNEHL